MEISILPLGKIEDIILNQIKKEIAITYNLRVKILKPMEIPKHTYNPIRKQFLASKIIEFLEKNLKGRILAVTDKDIYAKGLNFIFGQAQFRGRIAIISTHRLNPLFYKQFDQKLLIERAVKEAIHEIGHNLGLDHCPNPKCVMNFSNTIFDVDKKGKNLCNMCKIQLGV